MFETYIALCVKVSSSILYYAVKKFSAIGEHFEVSILCEKKIDKKVLVFTTFLLVIKLTHSCTLYFNTPRSSIYTDKIITYFGAQPPCLWVGIIIKKVIINKDRTSNLLGCHSVPCDTTQYGGSVIVCVTCIWLPSYENILMCLLSDEKFSRMNQENTRL